MCAFIIYVLEIDVMLILFKIVLLIINGSVSYLLITFNALCKIPNSKALYNICLYISDLQYFG